MPNNTNLKYTAIILLSFISLNIFGQSKANFVFFDACKNKTVELDYELWFMDSTIQVKAGQPVELKSKYYQLSTYIKWKEMYANFYFNIYITEEDRNDTLYLNRIRSYSPNVLHPGPESLKYYNCEKLCEGTTTELDSNHTIRSEGKFEKGIPTSKVKYYDQNGERIKTEVYRNGNLLRIK